MNHYIYVGNRNNVRLFYGIESKEFYYEEKSVVSSGMLIPLFTFITTVSYAIVRKLNDFTLVYNKEMFILVSAILGLLLSALLMRAARKSENEFFSKSQPVEIVEQGEIGKIVFEAKKIVGGRIMRSLIRIGTLIILMSLLFGCGKKETKIITVEDAKPVILEHLEEKYEQEFEILDLEKENIGQNFAKYIYKGTACVKGDETQTFDVTLFRDEMEIKDTYYSLFYGEQISQEIDEITDVEGITIEEIRLEYLENTDKFADYESYKMGGNVCVHFDMVVDATDYAEGVELAYGMLKELADNGVYFDVCIKIMDKEVIRFFDEYNELISKQELLERFEG